MIALFLHADGRRQEIKIQRPLDQITLAFPHVPQKPGIHRVHYTRKTFDRYPETDDGKLIYVERKA